MVVFFNDKNNSSVQACLASEVLSLNPSAVQANKQTNKNPQAWSLELWSRKAGKHCVNVDWLCPTGEACVVQ
jgi:hypothetical protein